MNSVLNGNMVDSVLVSARKGGICVDSNCDKDRAGNRVRIYAGNRFGSLDANEGLCCLPQLPRVERTDNEYDAPKDQCRWSPMSRTEPHYLNQDRQNAD